MTPVQQRPIASYVNTYAGTLSDSFATLPAIGSIVIVTGGAYNAAATFAVSDNQGNTYTVVSQTGADTTLFFAYCFVTASTGTFTVTATNGGRRSATMQITNWSAADLGTFLFLGNYDIAGSTLSRSIQTNNTGELILTLAGGNGTGGAYVTPSTFTTMDNVSLANCTFATAYKTGGAATTETVTWTGTSPTDSYNSISVAFLPPSTSTISILGTVQKTSGSSSSPATHTAVSGMVAGDLYINLSQNIGSTVVPVLDSTSTFTTIATGLDWTNHAYTHGYRVRTGTEATLVTTGAYLADMFFGLTGVDLYNPIESVQTATASAVTQTVPASTPTTDNCWHIVVFSDTNSDTTTITTPPSGYTLIDMVNYVGNAKVYAYYKNLGPGSKNVSTGTVSATWSAFAGGSVTGFIVRAAKTKRFTISEGTTGSGVFRQGVTDTRIRQVAPTVNYGTGASLETASFANGDFTRVLISFPGLSNFRGPRTVVSASLFLRCVDATNSNNDFDLHQLKVPFVETQATWNERITGTAWNTAGVYDNTDANSITAVASAQNVAINTWVEFTGPAFAALVEGWMNGSIPNYGLLMKRNNETADSTTNDFTSSNWGTAAYRPSLILTLADGTTTTLSGSQITGQKIDKSNPDTWLNLGNNIGASDEYNPNRSIMTIDTSGIPSTDIVTGITFNFSCNGTSVDGAETLAFHKLLAAPTMSQVTWNSRATGTAWQTGGASGASDSNGTPSFYATKITNGIINSVNGSGILSLVQDWVTNPSNNKGLMVKMLNDAALTGHYVSGTTFTATITHIAGSGISVPTVVSVSASAATEGSNEVHTVTLSGATTATTNYAVSLSNGTATVSSDLTSTLSTATYSNGVTYSSPNLVVPSGVTTFTVTLATATDALTEGAETYTLTVGGQNGVGTINDPAIPSITISDVSGNNLSGVMSFTITLSSPAGAGGASVQWATNDNTATAGSDYVAASGTATFAPGESTKTVNITIIP